MNTKKNRKHSDFDHFCKNWNRNRRMNVVQYRKRIEILNGNVCMRWHCTLTSIFSLISLNHFCCYYYVNILLLLLVLLVLFIFFAQLSIYCLWIYHLFELIFMSSDISCVLVIWISLHRLDKKSYAWKVLCFWKASAKTRARTHVQLVFYYSLCYPIQVCTHEMVQAYKTSRKLGNTRPLEVFLALNVVMKSIVCKTIYNIVV